MISVPFRPISSRSCVSGSCVSGESQAGSWAKTSGSRSGTIGSSTVDWGWYDWGSPLKSVYSANVCLGASVAGSDSALTVEPLQLIVYVFYYIGNSQVPSIFQSRGGTRAVEGRGWVGHRCDRSGLGNGETMNLRFPPSRRRSPSRGGNWEEARVRASPDACTVSETCDFTLTPRSSGGRLQCSPSHSFKVEGELGDGAGRAVGLWQMAARFNIISRAGVLPEGAG